MNVKYNYKDISDNLDFSLGKGVFNSMRPPLTPHRHPNAFELVYVSRGYQVYNVGATDYNLKGGEVFITFPDEMHGTGTAGEEVSEIYYLILPCPEGELFEIKGSRPIIEALYNIQGRIISGSEFYRSNFEKVLRLYFADDALKTIQITTLILEILIDVIGYGASGGARKTDWLTPVIDHINENIGMKISVEELARLAFMSESYFKRRFKNETGVPPHEYITRKCLDKARLLLKTTKLPIVDIAHMLDFNSSQHFSCIFKRYTNTTPTNFRRV